MSLGWRLSRRTVPSWNTPRRKISNIEEATMAALCKRFNHAASYSICQGALSDLLGMYADTDAAIEIFEGRFETPPGTDQCTKLVLDEILQKFGRRLANSVVVSVEDYQFYRKKARERTSSSISGLHYKSIAQDDELSELMAKKLSLITKTGAAPERWARGLTVMLKKMPALPLSQNFELYSYWERTTTSATS